MVSHTHTHIEERELREGILVHSRKRPRYFKSERGSKEVKKNRRWGGFTEGGGDQKGRKGEFLPPLKCVEIED